MLSSLLTSLLDIFGGMGYTAIFLLMAMESSIFPVPSEAVMIPAGYLVATGKLSFFWSLLAGTLGSLFGAIVNYSILGQLIGKPFLMKYGKYILIRQEKYEEAETLFQKNDRLYTFLGRLIPVVRHLISIPAGMFRMNLAWFVGLTTLGAWIYCLFLLLIGYYLWETAVEIIRNYTHEVSIAVVILGAIFVGWFLLKKKKKK